MRVLSLFSGAGGLDRGLELAGHEVVAQCEIDATCRELLREMWPETPIYDDVTTLDGRPWRGRVDLVAGGSPCQDLSVAGRRAGLDGERSGLFWHQCRIAAESAAGWVLWENVAGALSSNEGEDFAAVLWGLTGLRPAVPADGWRTVGVCVGPDRTAVWRLLDARWFGVAQRRRRVFVVAGPRARCGPEVLLEPESCGGDLAARPEAGEVVAALTSNGVGTCGPDDNQAQAGHLVVAVSEFELGEAEVYNSLRAGDGGSSRQNAVLTPDLTVRRLTPLECERLMGWPDDWTRHGAVGRVFADSHRYRMCGNGVVSNVAAWIGSRLPSGFDTSEKDQVTP